MLKGHPGPLWINNKSTPLKPCTACSLPFFCTCWIYGILSVSARKNGSATVKARQSVSETINKLWCKWNAVSPPSPHCKARSAALPTHNTALTRSSLRFNRARWKLHRAIRDLLRTNCGPFIYLFVCFFICKL